MESKEDHFVVFSVRNVQLEVDPRPEVAPAVLGSAASVSSALVTY